MDKKKIVSTIICIVFLVVSVDNFFRDLTPLLFILNIIGLICFLVLTYINIKEILLNISK
ncbi:immunity protein PncM [Streptococcus pneumoniae]|nr:immunity protein PncM [Streptococcus pneumoniae]VND83603.1 immunity protein PncM [Streptococcus pneumoniae]